MKAPTPISTNRRSRTWTLLGIPAAALALLWPALYNGQAFFMSDTSAYIRGVDAGVFALTGHRGSWSLPGPGPGTAADDRPATAAPSPDRPRPADSGVEAEFKSLSSIEEKTVLAGRSVYYGALLYAGSFEPRFWLTIAVQALLVVAAVVLTLQACGVATRSRVAASVILLCLTPAALFSSYLMPDVFAALTILASVNLIAVRRPPKALVNAFWFPLLSFALLAHSSHVLLTASVAGLGLALLALRRECVSTTGLAVIGAALLVAFAGNSAFEAAVRKFVGEPPIRPPFVMARMIADGPGYRYLRDSCPGSGYTVCRFVDRLPVTADEFLWSPDPRIGVFAVADPATRRALAGEHYRFVASVLGHEPLGQAAASLRNSAWQAIMIDTREFRYADWDQRYFAHKLPAEVYAVMRNTAAFRGTMPTGALTLLSYLAAALGLGVLAWLLVARRGETARLPGPTRVLVTLLVGGVIANAAICGSLSTPHDRYQARVAWLLPFAAMLLWFALRDRSGARDTRAAAPIAPKTASIGTSPML